MSTAYHPQTDGQTERLNQCLENYLRSMTFNQQRKWIKWLSLAEWWYNTNFHSSLKTTPFQALYGYPPPQLPMGTPPTSSVEAVDVLLWERHQMLMGLRDNLPVEGSKPLEEICGPITYVPSGNGRLEIGSIFNCNRTGKSRRQGQFKAQPPLLWAGHLKW